MDSRRRFMKAIFWTLSASLSALLSGIALSGFLSPVLRREADPGRMLDLGLLDDFPDNLPQARRVEMLREDGWNRQVERRRFYVLKSAAGCIVFSPVCTHLGCQVEWETGDGQFHCPCHGGRFNRDGEPVAGPPSHPLQRLPIVIRENRIYVRVGDRAAS